ncbi:cupin [Streptomyces noursei ATCC 11455]|nr:cupin [Streptomyces noursei ATCC 11455]
MGLAARAAGAKTRFHKAMSESFYVLSGELELVNGEKWVTGRAGDFLYVPVGGLHAFKNVTDEPMSMLMLFSPGAPREEFFERVAEMSQRGSEELKEFRVRHDSYFEEDFGAGFGAGFGARDGAVDRR